MSLFSRIDRIRGGRGGDDHEDDSVFAIPDLGKASSSAPPTVPGPAVQPDSPLSSEPVAVATPPAPVEAKTPAPAPAAPPIVPTAEPVPVVATAAPEAPTRRLSPLERLARRTAEVDEDGNGNLPDPVVPERPSMGHLLERLKAEPLADIAAPAPISDAELDEVPLPHAPFRRPSLFDQQAQSKADADVESEQPGASDDDFQPLLDLAAAEESAAEKPLEDDQPAPLESATASESESQSPFSSVILPPREMTGEETPPPPPVSGGTAFDRLMAARANATAKAAGAETPRSSAPSLAERLSAMRANANAEAATQAKDAAPATSDTAISEVAQSMGGASSNPGPEITFDLDTPLEDVLPPEPAPSEAPAEVEAQDDHTPEAQIVTGEEAANPSAIAMPASGLASPSPIAMGGASALKDTPEKASPAEPEGLPSFLSATPPPAFLPAEAPPAPVAETSTPAGPPLPWEAASEAATASEASAPVPPQPAAPPAPAVPSSPWAQRLAGRDALRDIPVSSMPRMPVEAAPAAAGAPTEALERAAGALSLTGGEGVAGESEARNRSLYRQKHFIFDAVLGSLDGRALQNPTREALKQPIERAVDSAIREFNLSLDNSDRNWMVEEFIREVTDLGPLVSLLDEVTVNKILVVGSTDVAVERFGRIERTGISFRDDDHLLSVVRRIADLTGGRIDAKVPLLDRPLPDGARIRAKIPPLAPQPTLTVEKSTGNPFTALKRQQAEKGRENALPYSQLRERIQQRLLREFEGNAAALSNPERLRGQVEEMIGLVIAEEKVVVSRAERASLVMDLLNEIVGLGPIEPLLNDPDIDEIMVNGPFQIYVERKGKLEIAPQRFRDNNHVMQVIERIVAPLGRRVDEKSPMVDGRLRDGSRFNAIIPPLALSGPTMTIRKFARDPLTMTDLINFGSLSREAAQFLQAAVEGKLNVIVSGGTGSGKTTTLNVLSSFIPSTDRIVTIEDAAELQLRQEHVVRLETRPPNIEGAGEIAIRDLVRNSLRMRPDRIVVGECRGGEALDMLQAMNTGHDGSLTTAHSNGPRDTIKRLETMVMMAGFDLPVRAIREQISMAVHLIVHQERMRDGKRRITAITELVGMEGEVVTMQDIFRFEQDRVDDEGRIIGTLAATGLRPQNFDNIVDNGVNLSMDLFQPRSMGGRDGDLRSRLSEHRVGTR